jgi:FG-GAP repeat
VPGALVRVGNNGRTVTTLPVPGLFQLTGLAVSALAAVPVSLQAAIGKSLGTAVSAAGYSQQAELTAAPGEFGFSVALSALGTTALVGAPVRNTGTGAAYVFTLRHRTWSRTAELTASGGAPFDDFGRSVALSALGSTALVGAPGRNKDTGAAYVFTLRRGTWSQTAELTGAPGDGFGFSVGLCALGSTALVGAPFHKTSTGAAYVFTLRRGTWSRTAVLTASHGAPGDDFGQSVALSALGSTALARAFGGSPFTGAAYVFTLRRGTWSRTAELTASDAAPGDEFGYSVALSALGTTALAGAPFRNTSTGAVYVFTESRSG